MQAPTDVRPASPMPDGQQAPSQAPVPTPVPPSHKRARAWLRIFGVGMLLYVTSVVILYLTNNVNLFPTVVLLGSFLVPVSFVSFFYERRSLSRLTMPTTTLAFFWGGILGVLAASVLEPLLIGGFGIFTLFTIAMIEEFAKLLGVFLLSWHHRHNWEIDGLILGAAAGMGFAALESTGYAFTAFFSSLGNLSTTVFVQLVRGLTSPLAHGAWTALLVGALFHESRPGRFRVSWRLLLTYAAVVVLHAFWNAVPVFVAIFGLPFLFVMLGQGGVGFIGLLLLWWRWHSATRAVLTQAYAPTS